MEYIYITITFVILFLTYWRYRILNSEANSSIEHIRVLKFDSAADEKIDISKEKLKNYKKQQVISFYIVVVAICLTIVVATIMVLSLIFSGIGYKLIIYLAIDVGSFTLAKNAFAFYKTISDRYDSI